MNANKQTDKMMMISSSILVFLCILTILLPFNALINTFFTEKLGFGLLKFWKEILFGLSISLGIAAGGFRKWEKNWVFGFGLSFIALILLYSVSLGFGMNSLRVLRLELLPMVSLFGFIGLVKVLNNQQKDKLSKVLLFSGVFGVAVGAIFFSIFGSEGLVLLGYRMDWSTFYTGEALAFCQKIENSEICRFQGFLSGPNQMGVYLSLIAAVLASRWSKEDKIVRGGLLIIIISLLILTFSRSSLLALIAMGTVYGLIKYKNLLINHWKKMFIVGLTSIAGFTYIFFEPIRLFFSRPESNSERLRLMREGLEFWMESFLFGNGAGSIGPASRYVSATPLIPENWFIQVGGQFGLIGLLLFIGWYAGVIIDLYKKQSYIGVALMTGILIPLSLLHTFEAAAFVYGLTIFLALELNKVED